MNAYTYIEEGLFTLLDKPKPKILDTQDAIVKVTLVIICTSDLHIRHNSAPHAVSGITVVLKMEGITDRSRFIRGK